MVRYQVNSESFNETVKEALKSVKDLRPAFIQVAREFYKANRAIFTLKSAGQYPDFKGAKIRETWQNPGKPERRKRNGEYTAYQWFKQSETGFNGGYPLLKFSGRLEKSITDPSSAETALTITPQTIIMGTNVEYAQYHQGYDGEGAKKIPFRPFLFLDPSTAKSFSSIISRRNTAWMKAIRSYVFRSVSKPLTGKDEASDV